MGQHQSASLVREIEFGYIVVREVQFNDAPKQVAGKQKKKLMRRLRLKVAEGLWLAHVFRLVPRCLSVLVMLLVNWQVENAGVSPEALAVDWTRRRSLPRWFKKSWSMP